MLYISILLRILSNPLANVFQKKLTKNYGSFFVNTLTYGGLTILMSPFFYKMLSIQSINIWIYGITGGLFGAFGNACLVKALSYGDLSVLGPINAYKPIVALLFGIVLLSESPSVICLFAIGLILIGSYFVFDTTDEKFTLKFLLRKDIQYRFLALFFTAIEAIIIKQVIILSDIWVSFIFWCLFGFIFSAVFSLCKKEKIVSLNKNSLWLISGLISMFGLMQITTNYVFKNMNVSYALALFQLSSIVSIFFGYKIFKETHILKKLFGTIVMVIGAVIIILCK